MAAPYTVDYIKEIILQLGRKYIISKFLFLQFYISFQMYSKALYLKVMDQHETILVQSSFQESKSYNKKQQIQTFKI